MVQQPVEHGRGQHGVLVKNAGPVLVDSVRRNQRCTSLVAVADDLEESVDAELVDGQIPKFVNAQDPRLGVALQRVLDAASWPARRRVC